MPVEPVKIIEISEREIAIEWSDSSEDSFAAPVLRRACPCAGCINEWTGEKMLTDGEISDDIAFSHTSLVGRYALNFHFTDGHETGIYSFRFLKELAESQS